MLKSYIGIQVIALRAIALQAIALRAIALRAIALQTIAVRASLYGLRYTGYRCISPYIAVPLRHKAFVQFCVYMPLLTSQIFSAGMRHIYMLEQTTLFPIRHSPTADAMEHGTRGYAARKNTFLGILV